MLRFKSVSIIEELLFRCVLPFDVDFKDDGIVDELSKQKQFRKLFKTEALCVHAVDTTRYCVYRCACADCFFFDHPRLRVTAPLMLYPYLKDAKNKMTRLIIDILDETNLFDNQIISDIICDYLYFDYNNYYDMNLIDKILQNNIINNNCTDNNNSNDHEIEQNIIFKAVLLLNDLYYIPMTDNKIFFDQLIKYYCSDAAFVNRVFGKKSQQDKYKECQYLNYNVMLTVATKHKIDFNIKGILEFISLMNKNNISNTKLLFWNNEYNNLLTFAQEIMISGQEKVIRDNIDEWIKFFTCISQSCVENGIAFNCNNTIRQILKSKIIPSIITILTFKNKKSRRGNIYKKFEYINIDHIDIDSKEYSNYLLCFKIIKCLKDNFFTDNIYPWVLLIVNILIQLM